MTHVAALAAAALLGGWTQIGTSPHGGTVWTGRIGAGQGDIYLPPGYSRRTRYRVLYLLHGIPGSPAEYWHSLHLAADEPPYIVVTPQGPKAGEWVGAWERYVVGQVVPFVDAHLSTIRSTAGRALEGLSAGGYGAVDIGLRHPRLFGTLGAWDGYFTPFRDGALAEASRATLRAHDPALLLAHDAPLLRRERVRFYVSVGGNHGNVLASWSLSFVKELARYGLAYELWRLPPADQGRFWSATVPSALRYAFPRA